MFKQASWFLALSLGALLFYTCSQVPFEGDSPLSLHLAPRYLQMSVRETGIHSPTGAVAGDYRGLDLFVVGFLFFLSAMSLFLFWTASPGATVFFPALFWVSGACLTLGLGFFTLHHGSNFLDYEAMAFWGEASFARLNGVLLLTAGVLLCLGGFILMAVQWARVPEAAGER